MQVLTTVSEARSWIHNKSLGSDSVGLVPTMGALHEGHLSLIRQCSLDNDINAVTIFVNPTQFNETTDFESYPRDLEKDLEMIERQSCDMVFTPSVAEMYPEKDRQKFDFGKLDKTMEAVHRPGHFIGVAQIVSKLFAIIEPDRAYFGEKDFQQLAIIRSLVRKLNLPVEVIGCPIIREADGLAMSSRNRLLSAGERKAASIIPKTLSAAVDLKNKPSPGELKEMVIQTINSDHGLEVEYFEIVDKEDLAPVSNWTGGGEFRACIAVRCGMIRLIDNMNISY
ncbi:MAG: pantoate--beta-alanine ligase [Bacteroidales bacterium]|nr:pantoate--beta-alanine ligase [Bacteroidales bacterium]